MFNFADKSNNIFEMTPQDHGKLIMENITKTDQNASDKLEKAISIKAKNITRSYELAERIDHLLRSETFITLKDHKDNFYSKSSCRLITPLSPPSPEKKTCINQKKIIEQLNQEILKKTDVKQWKNTRNVIIWFNNIKKKKDCSFIQFDMKESIL